jgi:uncharacterized protein (TIGR02145 family)
MKKLTYLLILISAGLFSCKKDKAALTVTDIDGNVYKTVKIGDQIWMAENLKVTQFNDGTSLSMVTDPTTWGDPAITEPMASFYDNKAENIDKYGLLYNWYAISSNKLAPKGWHVATEADWDNLKNYLKTNAGGKLKEKGVSNWLSPNIGATNETGFTCLPSGLRWGGDGKFLWQKEQAYFWTISQDLNSMSPIYNLYYNSSDVLTFEGSSYGKNVGLSVRCVKD